MKPTTEGEIRSYFEGARMALRLYAIRHNGTQIVGCGVRSLNQALADINAVEIRSLNHFASTGEAWPGLHAPIKGGD